MITPQRLVIAANLSAVLALGLVAAWAFEPVATPAPLPPAPVLPDGLATSRPAVDAEALLRAPIFNPARELGSDTASGGAPSAPPPVLAGLIGSGGSGIALVIEGGSQRVLRIGEESAGWRLLAIRARGAEFVRGSERAAVRLIPDDYRSRGAPGTASSTQTSMLGAVPGQQ